MSKITYTQEILYKPFTIKGGSTITKFQVEQLSFFPGDACYIICNKGYNSIDFLHFASIKKFTKNGFYWFNKILGKSVSGFCSFDKMVFDV